MTKSILPASNTTIFNEAEQAAADKLLSILTKLTPDICDLSLVAGAYKSLTEAAAVRAHVLMHAELNAKQTTEGSSDQ